MPRLPSRKVWEDMLAMMEKLEMPISEKRRNYFLKGYNRASLKRTTWGNYFCTATSTIVAFCDPLSSTFSARLQSQE